MVVHIPRKMLNLHDVDAKNQKLIDQRIINPK